ncbi:50S ribosomal protein L32e [Thermogladius calderae 1633]|uniref:Large ribosomal subunit protein eL32 n=1 Tax=Thermogladius calderae (strain DSM 22663 / VKM B-2946 / 1633) TaxID=1184251 RepID=I3TDD0_THEC1|nr:50S ribosomal protein L32e [Thermogladius calderae 1633]
MWGLKSRIERLLELRRKIKEKKPEFLRYLWWKKPKFENDLKWRKPKGIDNKVRRKLKGYPPLVSVGYGGPAEVRGYHPSGLIPVTVSNVDEIDKLDPSKNIIYISATTGLKKKIEIYRAAVAKGFKVANPPAVAEGMR